MQIIPLHHRGLGQRAQQASYASLEIWYSDSKKGLILPIVVYLLSFLKGYHLYCIFCHTPIDVFWSMCNMESRSNFEASVSHVNQRLTWGWIVLPFQEAEKLQLVLGHITLYYPRTGSIRASFQQVLSEQNWPETKVFFHYFEELQSPKTISGKG